MRQHRSSKSGFTLIEIMAALGVFALLTLVLAEMFLASNRAFRQGSALSQQSTSGRAALNFLSRDLSQAIFDSERGVCALKLESDKDTGAYGKDGDRLYFMSAGEVRDNGTSWFRQMNQVVYMLVETPPDTGAGGDEREFPCYNLVRYTVPGETARSSTSNSAEYKSGEYTTYKINTVGGVDWWDDLRAVTPQNSDVLVPFVRTFEVWVYDKNGNAISNYDSRPVSIGGNGPPSYADIYLEVLGEEHASIADLSVDPEDYCDRNAKRYFTRVYFRSAFGNNPDLMQP